MPIVRLHPLGFAIHFDFGRARSKGTYFAAQYLSTQSQAPLHQNLSLKNSVSCRASLRRKARRRDIAAGKRQSSHSLIVRAC